MNNRNQTKTILTTIITLFILGAGAFLRIYKLGAQKLWVDELYTAQLIEGGLSKIWQTALIDVLHPVSMLPFWLVGEFLGDSPAKLRLVSLLASLIALFLFYFLSRKELDDKSALTASWFFAISPLAVYYAQEARPYALGLMGVLLTMAAFSLLEKKKTPINWAIYTIAACLASQLYYLNTMIVGGQILALIILSDDRKKTFIGGVIVVLLVTITIGPFALGALQITPGWDQRTPLGFLSAMQTMLNGDIRISSSISRWMALSAVTIGLAIGIYHAFRDQSIRRKLIPFLFPIGLVILVAFVLLPIIGKNPPKHDERAFLMILPSVLMCFGIGISQLTTQWKDRIILSVLIAVFTIASISSLTQYFNHFNKSIEGEIAEKIISQTKNGDCVITNHDAYSTDAALRYYKNDLPIYRFHHQQNGEYFFTPTSSILLLDQGREPSTLIELNNITNCNRFWVVKRSADLAFIDSLQSQYKTREEFFLGPFQTLLMKRISDS
jgi:uncharacterized membrane protein